MKHKILAITIASALGLAGCGGSGSDNGNDGGTPGSSATNFSGTVNKGIVNNGKVEVCDTFDAQGCNSQAGFYLATTTNASGQYSIKGAPLNKPLMVIASKKDNTTTMKCDVETCTDASGNTVDFGKTFVVADGWQLKTILPEANSTTSMVNVTSLTDIAAEQALEDAGSGQVTVAIANKAKDFVEDIFGLEGSITELGAVDLTDPSQTQKASPEEINAALYSAAVMSSGINTDALIQPKGDNYQVSPSLLTVISDAEKLVNSDAPLVKASEVSKKELTDLDADWRHGSHAFKDKDGDGKLDPVEIKPQQPIVDKVQAAKSFINDVRTTYMSVQDDGDLSKGVADFGEELEVMAPLVEQDAEKALNNVQQAVEAIVAKFDNKPAEDNGFTVTVEGTTYTAARTASDSGATTVVANLKKVDIVEPEDQSSDEGIATADIDLEVVSINSTVGNVVLTGHGFAKVEGFVDGRSNQNDHTGWSESEDLSVNTVALSLEDVKMTFDDSAKGKSAQFDGVISASVTGLSLTEEEASNWGWKNGENAWEDVNQKQETGTFSLAKLMFSGDLKAGHDTAGVYLNIVADNKRGYVAENSSLFRRICSWDQYYSYCSDSNEETDTPETADKYLAAYITAQVSTDVQNALNNNVAASVKLEVNRSKFDVADAKVTVGYNDADTIIEAPVGLYDKKFDSDIIIRNKAGVEATITDYKDTVAGEIKINGEKVATIVEVDNGLVLVRYTDGSFESLF